MTLVDWIPVLLLFVGGCCLFRHGLKKELVHPLVGVSLVFAYFFIAPAIVYATGKVPPSWMEGLLLLTGAAGLILLGYYATPSINLPPIQSPSRKILLLVGLAWFVLGLLLFGYYILVNGGLMRMLTVVPRTAFQTVPETARYRVLGLAGLFSGTILVLAGAELQFDREDLQSRPKEYSLVILVLALTFSAAILTRERMTIAFLPAVTGVYLYVRGRITTRHILLGGGVVIPILILFTFLEHLVTGNADFGQITRSALNPLRLKAFLAVVHAVPQEVPYQYGTTFLRALLIEWPGMPLRAGDQIEIILQGRDRPGITLSGTLLAEFYLNFGALGVLIGSAILGVVYKIIYQLRTSSGYPLSDALYAALVIGSVVALPTSMPWVSKAVGIRLAPLILTAVILAAFRWSRADVELTCSQ